MTEDGTTLPTSNPAKFRDALQQGDVLVYDSITHADAGLVQWADAAPVNHASLVLDRDSVMEANRPVAEGQPAVRQEALEGRLDVPGIRTITALRHVAVQRPADADAVVARARDYEGTGIFSYADILVLVPPGLARSYAHDIDDKGVLGRVFKATLDIAIALAARIPASGGRKLTCSEFVYRCFAEATPEPFTIDIDRPLRSEPGRGLVPDRSRPPWMDDADEERLEQLLAALSDPPRGFGPDAGLGKPSEADVVSPGDLWRSNSLTPVAVLHHPPQRKWAWPVDPPGPRLG